MPASLFWVGCSCIEYRLEIASYYYAWLYWFILDIEDLHISQLFKTKFVYDMHCKLENILLRF